MATENNQLSVHFSWAWVGISFCFFVTFHLLPTFLFGIVDLTRENIYYAPYSEGFSFFMMASVLAFISGFLGYKSHGRDVLEPVFAMTMYIIFLGYVLPLLYPAKSHNDFSSPLIIFLSIFATSAVSTYVGSVIWIRKEHKAAAAI